MRKISPRLWTTFILIGLVGQFAWTIENMYFNVYLYNTITTDPTYIAWMVAASAIAATLTTLIMGAVSDRAGNRKRFICWGYLLWGGATAAFGLLTVENAAKVFPLANAAAAAAILVVALDCVMTFFGSTANDAAFNAYITDNVENEHRGRVESVLAILPLIAMLIIFGAFDSMTQRGEWQKFFGIFGGLVSLVGLIGFFLIPETKVERKHTPFFESLLYGFKPGVVRSQPNLYLSLCAMCVFSIAVQVFFPYLIIYMQHFLMMDNYAMVLGVVLIVASVVSVLFGKTIDRAGKMRFTLIAAGVMLIGLIGMYFVRDAVAVIVAGSVMMSGFMLVTASLSAEIRDRTPEDKAGHFQGIRMIFAVMLPMLIGPFIGAAVIRGNAQTYVDLGSTKTVPTPEIFLAAGAILLLVLIPVLLLKRRENE